ncbi:MAG TPA: hypothetical protein VNQ81_03570 [Povalibacter sp.]|nr:hypothetical protein [Povalibacter sp.]
MPAYAVKWLLDGQRWAPTRKLRIAGGYEKLKQERSERLEP